MSDPRARQLAEQRFPIQEVGSIPWALAEQAYATYARHFGTDQSLARIAERGGFGLVEFACLLAGHKPLHGWPADHHNRCVAGAVRLILAALTAAEARPPQQSWCPHCGLSGTHSAECRYEQFATSPVAAAEARGPHPQQNWQPIATAPKDRERHLLFVPDEETSSYSRQIGSWCDDTQEDPFWLYEGERQELYSRAHQPTHWMPLPDPPVEARGPVPAPQQEIARLTKERDDARHLLGQAAREINVAGPVHERIRVFRHTLTEAAHDEFQRGVRQGLRDAAKVVEEVFGEPLPLTASGVADLLRQRATEPRQAADQSPSGLPKVPAGDPAHSVSPPSGVE